MKALKRVLYFLPILLIGFSSSRAQGPRIDSLSQLIDQTADPARKAGWLMQRSRAWHPTAIDRPLADAQQALAIYQQLPQTRGQIEAYLQIGGIYTRQNKFQLAIEVDSMALLLAEKEKDIRNTAQALAHLSRNFQGLGDLKKTEATLLKALDLQKQLNSEREMADTHNRLGVFYRHQPDIKKALYHYDEAIPIAKKFNIVPLLASLYMNKAVILQEAARYDEAADMHLESIRLKEQINDQRGLMQSYNNMAVVLRRVGELEQSKSYFLRANQLARQFNNPLLLGFNYNNLAILYTQLQQKDSVPILLNLALSSFQQAGDKPGQAMAHHNLGQFLLEEKKYPESEQALEKALAMRRVLNDKYDLASTLNLLGALYSRTRRTEKAEDLLLQSIDLLREENSFRKKDAYVYLAEHYRSVGNFENAYKFQAAYLAMNDTLVDEKEVMNLLRRSSQYELEKKDAELLLEKNEKKLQALALSKKNQWLLFLSASILLLSIILLLLWRYGRQKKKHAEWLTKKNEQVETLIRELHHRVKNNLQTVSGLLSLQGNRIDNEEWRNLMEEGRGRVEAMALIHQKLYLQNDVAAIPMADYLRDLLQHLAASYGFDSSVVETTIQLSSTSLDIDRAVPVGLIVNELASNAFKYAFANNPTPRLEIRLVEKDDLLLLTIADNGVGHSGGKAAEMAFGRRLVGLLVQQLNAEMEQSVVNGTYYRITMKKKG